MAAHTKPIRVAVVGLGWVALHRHVPAMRANPAFELAGVIDRRPGHAAAVAKSLGLLHWAQASSLDGIDWLDSIDAITVATAPMAHYALVKEALLRGKHVLTEKPFTMTVAEGEELVAISAQAQRHLAIVHNFQFARSTKCLEADLVAGTLGTITGIDAVQFGNPGRRLPVWYEDLPLGLFYDESPHLLYLMGAIAGDMKLARALIVPSSKGLKTPARIDAYFTAAKLPVPIALRCNFESPVSEWYMMVFGEKRLAIVDVFRDIYISLPNDGSHDTLRVLRTSIAATTQHWWQHVTSGIPHLTGRLLYGNDELYGRFGRAIGGDAAAIAPINGARALGVLKLQHDIITRREEAYPA